MSHPLTDTPRLRPALRIMIRALLALFLVAVAALVMITRLAMGGIGPVFLAVVAVALLVVAPLAWEAVMTSRSVAESRRQPTTFVHPAHAEGLPRAVPGGPSSARTGKRAWTAPRPSIWTQTPQPRDWFSHRAPRLAGWDGGASANCISDPGTSLKSG